MRLNPTPRRLVPAAVVISLFAVMPASGQVLNEDVKITASDGAALDQFGRSVSISGTTAIVGSPRDADAGINSGSAYLFDAATGLQISKLTASDAAELDQFGWAVAISGTTAIVGAFNDRDAGIGSGSAYLFDVTTGLQIFKLRATDAAAGDEFGWSVGKSGTTAIVGAPYNSDAGFASGSAYLFDTTTGLQIAKLTASDAAAGDFFGGSVAISGMTAIVGAPGKDGAGVDSGAVYLFDVATGQQIAKLAALDAAAFDQFGWSVAIAGTTAIVGARWDGDAGTSSGSAYTFDSATGQQLAKLSASDAAPGDEFGISVSIDGNIAIVGSHRDDTAGSGSGSGSAYLFDAITGHQIAKLTGSDAASGDFFGASVAISGGTAIVGSVFDDDAGNASGSAYLFKGTPTINAQPQSRIVEIGATAIFQVEVARPNLVSYRWRRDGINITDGGNISGSDSATLQIVATESDLAYYDCVITGWGPSGLTEQAVLGVRPDPDPCFADFNNDGILNFFDVSGFINAYNAGCAP